MRRRGLRLRAPTTLLLAGLLTTGAIAQSPSTQETPAADPAPGMAVFANRNRSFRIDLPKDWRQIAPNEALSVADHPSSPRELRHAEPNSQYAVGPVDRWLAGDFQGAWLYVTEIPEEAVIPEDFAGALRDMWQKHGAANALTHELTDIQREKIGPLHHPVITARRTTTGQGHKLRCLDVYASSGRQQVTLSFTADAAEFDRWEPRFREWLATATFARPPRTDAKLSDRLWTPLITGGIVALLLIALYKHTHRRR